MRPTRTSSDVKDQGKVRLGAGMKNSAQPVPRSNTSPADVTDAGKVRMGAGMRRRSTAA